MVESPEPSTKVQLNTLFKRLDAILLRIESDDKSIMLSNPFSLGKAINIADPALMKDLALAMETDPGIERLYSFHNPSVIRLRLSQSGNAYRSAAYNEAKKILTIMCPRDY